MEVVVAIVRTLVPLPPAERVMLVMLRVATIPVLVTEVVREIVPAKELMLVSVTVVEAEEPACIVRLTGFEDIVKSG